MFKSKKKEPEMTPEERVEQQLREKFEPILTRKISESIINGVNLCFGQLYDEFVEEYDLEKDPVEKARIVEKMMSAIRVGKLKSLQREGFAKNEKNDSM